MSESEEQSIRHRIERISHVRWFSRWPGYGPLHQSLKLSILRKFFIPRAVVIETGTATGRTALALAEAGHPIHTIEVDEPTFRLAARRLSHQPDVKVHLGDSATLLPTLFAEAAKGGSPVNFWLDGHYCGYGDNETRGDTPIVTELAAIGTDVGAGDVAVAIDDFRLFGNDPAYPNKTFLVEWAGRNGLYWYVSGDIFIATTRQHPDC